MRNRNIIAAAMVLPLMLGMTACSGNKDDNDGNAAVQSATTSTKVTDSKTSSAKPTDASSFAPKGANTVTGTVRVLDAQKILQMQNKPDPTGGQDKNSYAVLVLDQPQPFTALPGAGPATTTQTAQMVLLGAKGPDGNTGRGFDKDGQHTTMTFDPQSCRFPGGAAIPVDQPRCDR